MNSEGLTIALFQSIGSQGFNNYLGLTPTLIGAFSIEEEEEPEISLSLFKTSLLLKDKTKHYSVLELTFQTKLEILYLENKDVTTEIIGFSLYTEQDELVSFYGFDAPQFSQVLGKVLNMKGFQQMFRPIRKLGKGNFATVYEAERKTDGRKFAVKAFSKQNSYCAKNGRENLINELSLLRSLNVEPHPNVLRLEAVYESQNSIYVVLQFLEGKTLLETIQQRTGELLSTSEVQIIMTGLMRGTAHLCKNRVMHRDLKPENIMIRKDTFEPVIVDFGLSTNVDLPEYLFFRCGTPGYVAPQIIRLTESVHLEPTCDVFSLGSIFHILLINRPLFPGIRYDEVYRSNKEFNIDFSGDQYKSIDQNSIDLMRKLLILPAQERITAEEALKHPFYISMTMTKKEEATTFDAQTLTAIVSPSEKKKKKKFFFF